ncbi:hypothetical protein [Jiella mangrovi]|uniref:Uncharacterized protein n=1 Tax=Jiella mangrovi TaxID=2821407 RepID=A0ABS4BNS7_9HYPH|nr:hypothetical protein [Jiella mangrovi]MBP0617871.1 hypothetical protein [Jiella mangrovi]
MASCVERDGEGESDGFRPIGGELRRYRPPKPVLEWLQLGGAVLLCAALIGGFLG